MFSAAAFIIASSFLTRFLYTYTKNETWIPIVLAMAASMLLVSVYGRLARSYPRMTLIEIDDAVFGKVMGKIVSALYVFYFFTLIVLNTEDLGNFVEGFVLPSTPISVTYVIFLLLCSFAVRKGAVSMTRYAAVLTIIYIAAVLINTLLLINKMHPENLVPMFRVSVKNYLLGTHLTTMLPFCEIMALMMFTPYLQKPEETGKALRGGLLIGFIVLLTIIVRDIVVLGEYTLTATMPTYSSIRLIDVGDILTRLEIVFAVLLITMLFFKVSILFFSTVTGLSRLVHIDNHKIFIMILIALSVVYSNGMFRSVFEHTKWTTAAPVYSTFFLLVLPSVTLVIAFCRDFNKEGIMEL